MAQPAHAATAVEKKKSRLAWRTWVPWTLIVLATVIGIVAALNVWVKRQALSTDNWTNASSRLLENDQIRSAISIYLVNQLYQNVDVQQQLQQQLPPRLKPLSGPIAANLQGVATNAIDQLLARPRVQELWKNANRRAHKLFMAVIDGKHGALVQTDGNVVLNLRPILERFVEETGYGQRLLDRLPPDAGQLVVMKGNQLGTARKAVKVIRVMSYILFFLVIALYAAAIYLARDRRKLLMATGVSVVLVGLIVLVVRRFAGNYLVDQLTSNPDAKGAVTASWAIGTELLRNVGFNALVYGIVIIFGAWIAGTSRPATWARRELAPTMRDRPVVIYGFVTLVLFLVLLAGPTDAQRIFPLLILFAFAYVGTEILRRQTLREFPAGSEGRAEVTA